MAIPDVKLKSNGDYWQAYWSDASGARQVRSLGPKRELSRRQANVRCREMAIDLERTGTASGARAVPRLSEWIDQYKSQRTELEASTLYLVTAARTYLTRYFDNDPPIDRITRADAADWRRAMAVGELSIDNANRCEPPAESTVCKHVRTVKRIFREAEDQNYIQANPFGKLRSTAPKVNRQWREIGPKEMKLILAACPSIGWRSLFALCRFAGLRRGEALDLRWQDVKFGDNRMTVNATIETETTKRAVRVCPIEPAKCPTGLTEILREAFDAAPAGAVKVCSDIQVSNIDLKARRIIVAAGIGLYAKPFHTLRKCWATQVAQKYPMPVLVEWLGHDIGVSLSHYQRVPEALFRAPRKAKAQTVPDGVQTSR